MQKLELTWIGKGEEPVVEPRILLHDPSKDYGDPSANNMLIHGDNLLTLKALEQEFAGQVKCIYIDPPFNTGARINADGEEIGYDDGIEHSIWLNLMYSRFSILKNLLSEDGAIFVHLDDNEADYCRLLMDEVFHRKNFINRITIDARSPSAFSTVNKGVFKASEYILFYVKNKEKFVEYPVRTERVPDYAYDKWLINPEDDFSMWKFSTVAKEYENQENQTSKKPQTILNNYHKFIIENAHHIFRFTSISDSGAGQATVELKRHSLQNPDIIFKQERIGNDDIYIFNGQQISFYSKNIAEIDGKKVASTMLTNIWTDIAWEGIAGEGNVKFKKGKKPERLVRRCLELATSKNDLVLDSFLGSGTTAAVAHKMGRRYIGIELGTHCYTHCLPRLQRVVDGEQSGISKVVNWQGGGGFKFYELAPTLIVKDAHGQPIINDKYNAQMLVAAIAKLNGYDYAPDADVFWKQGKSQVGSYIFVTTEYITAAQLDDISRDLPEYERLLICAPAFDIGLGKRYENINVRKIPQSVLDKCEYGADNYNLNIVNPPELDEDEWEDGEDA
jgi:adenine-specific DNA-methyltransferase